MKTVPLVNIDNALSLLDNDKELYTDLLDMFLTSTSFNVEELLLLEKNGNYPEAGKRVHYLKGAVGALGGERLFSVCQTLEDTLKGKIDGDIPTLTEQTISIYNETLVELQKVHKS